MRNQELITAETEAKESFVSMAHMRILGILLRDTFFDCIPPLHILGILVLDTTLWFLVGCGVLDVPRQNRRNLTSSLLPAR